MRALLVAPLAAALLGCGGGDSCEDACQKMASCLGFASEAGAPEEGEAGWTCPLGGETCEPQKRCFARCNLDATCEEIRHPNQPSAYKTCREQCLAQHFGQDAGVQGDAAPPADEGTGHDQDTQYWVCEQGSESYLLAGCSFGWTCPAGEDRALECKQAGEGTQSCTCKNNKKGTEEGSFQAEGICGELPWQEITSQANTHCGWKIKDKSPKP